MIDKLIFLDIDGVLNNEKWVRHIVLETKDKDMQRKTKADPTAVRRLCEICEKTGARIIISSSWRTLTVDNTIERLKDYPDQFNCMLKYIVGVTGRYSEYYIRGIEITKFLSYLKDESYKTSVKIAALIKSNIEISKNPDYVIIDDDCDMEQYQVPHFMQTTYYDGLTDKQKDSIIKFLNGEIFDLSKEACNNFKEIYKES